MVGERFATEEHVPGWRFYAVFAVFLLASSVIGFYVASQYSWGEIAPLYLWPWFLGLVMLGLVAPYLAQYLVLRCLGTRPRRVKWGERSNTLFFVSYWKARDHKFTRRQFVIVYCLPVLILYTVTLVYAFRFPTATPILAFVLPFHLGNLWFATLVLREPVGTLAEVYGRGLRLYRAAGDRVT